ncbi:MAG: DVU0524 family FlgM-associated protein [Thermodesulfobacteriota bacterium]|nr:DVU0524 family FlgM-associated protein [Thermodesulfobacteriota bacterium]
MQISSYQIQNVLKVYSRQLSQGKILARNKDIGRGQTSADNVNISSEGKRAAVIDKVAASIVDKITTAGPKEEMEQKITSQIEKEIGQKINFTEKKEEKFSYTTIDENNNKTVKTLSVEDSDFVIKRMTELARKAADNNMES